VVERTIASGVLSPRGCAALRRVTTALHPSALSREISDLAAELERRSITKAPTPIQKRVNSAFNATPHPEVLGESTNWRADSKGRRDKLVESFRRSIPVEGLARALIEQRGDLVEVGLRVDR
jgi:hypothetical protein